VIKMAKAVECEIFSWKDLPILCGVRELMKLGMGENEARAFLNRPDAPVIEYGLGKRIEKYSLKRYLQKGVKKDA
jgi:hypothetical protein